jgi:integrase
VASEKLTAVQAKTKERGKTKSGKTKKRGMYGDGKGLWLSVGTGGAKSWVLRYMIDGKAREMGLGSYGDLTLAKAREEARTCRLQIREGIDPIEARRERRAAQQVERAKAMTFRQCAEAYIAAHKAEWTNEKHRKQWSKTFVADEEPYVPTAIGKLPVAAIDEAIVMKILAPLWEAKPSTAGRVRGRIESVLDWATTSKFRTGDNPARWKGHLEHLLAKPEKASEDRRLAALPYTEMGAFMAELRRRDGTAARALEFTILTAARAGESFGTTWSEIDQKNDKLWVVPSQRMKAGAEHRVPLSGAALAVLNEMRKIRRTELVFEGARAGRPLSHEAMLRVLKAMGRGDLTVHGFRSTFRDWCGDMTNFPREICEAALAHAVGSKVEAAYRRGSALEKRRQLMEAWAKYCARPAISADVVSLAGGR